MEKNYLAIRFVISQTSCGAREQRQENLKVKTLILENVQTWIEPICTELPMSGVTSASSPIMRSL